LTTERVDERRRKVDPQVFHPDFHLLLSHQLAEYAPLLRKEPESLVHLLAKPFLISILKSDHRTRKAHQPTILLYRLKSADGIPRVKPNDAPLHILHHRSKMRRIGHANAKHELRLRQRLAAKPKPLRIGHSLTEVLRPHRCHQFAYDANTILTVNHAGQHDHSHHNTPYEKSMHL